MNISKYITEGEVSKITSLSLSKLRQDRHKRQGFPYFKIGKSVRYRLEDVEEYLNQHLITFEEKQTVGGAEK